MREKCIEKFLEMKEEKQLRYDFTDDCIKRGAYEERYEEKKDLEKFFIYRSLGIDKNKQDKDVKPIIDHNLKVYGNIEDPDSASKLLQDIYSLLWTEIRKDKSEYMIKKGWIYSDTMTSAQTVLNDYINKAEKFENVRDRIKGKFGQGAKASHKVCVWLYKNDLEFQSLLDTDKSLVDFINAYHTLGNYIVVPYGFNTARSGNYASHDQWDLTLMKIKEYYDAKKECSYGDVLTNFESPEVKIIELLHHNEVISCYKWLNSFKDWKDFIDTNLLQDFVDEKYEPKPFCKGHSWGDLQIKNFDEFFKNAQQAIEARSKRMIDRLREKTLKSV